MTFQRGKKNHKIVPNELDAFAVGRIREHWLSEYENLDDVPNLKEKLGETTIFCVVNTIQ
jgi:hypothetical protein